MTVNIEDPELVERVAESARRWHGPKVSAARVGLTTDQYKAVCRREGIPYRGAKSHRENRSLGHALADNHITLHRDNTWWVYRDNPYGIDDINQELRLFGLPVLQFDAKKSLWIIEDKEALTIDALVRCHGFRLYPHAMRELRQQTSQAPVSQSAKYNDLWAKLRPYQQVGVEHLQEAGALIADDMGLGKTLQALTAVERKAAYPCVVVCPPSVVSSWVKEVEKWVPWRSCAFVEEDEDADIIISTPNRLTKYQGRLQAVLPRALVLDEIHYYKNSGSKRSRAALALARASDHVIGLSGTPIRNRRNDLVFILKILNRLGDVIMHAPDHAQRNYFETGSLQAAKRAIKSIESLELNKVLTEKIMLRRVKDDLKDQVPALSKHELRIAFSNTSTYSKTEQRLLDWAKKHDQVLKNKFLSKQQRAQSSIQGYSLLQELRSACGVEKIDAVTEWMQELLNADRGAVIFTHHRSVADLLMQRAPGRCALVNGSTPQSTRTAILANASDYDFIIAGIHTWGEGVDGLQHHFDAMAFLELDWTPAAHDQAEGRLHRTGQKRPVDAYYFVLEDSFDERVWRLLQGKAADRDAIIDGKESDSAHAFAEAMIKRIIDQKAWERGDIQWT